MILKKSWFLDIEIVDIYQQVNREKSPQYPITRPETKYTEKQETPYQAETQNNENRITTHLNTIKKTKKR